MLSQLVDTYLELSFFIVMEILEGPNIKEEDLIKLKISHYYFSKLIKIQFYLFKSIYIGICIKLGIIVAKWCVIPWKEPNFTFRFLKLVLGPKFCFLLPL